jgi:hypothetical protein
MDWLYYRLYSKRSGEVWEKLREILNNKLVRQTQDHRRRDVRLWNLIWTTRIQCIDNPRPNISNINNIIILLWDSILSKNSWKN